MPASDPRTGDPGARPVFSGSVLTTRAPGSAAVLPPAPVGRARWACGPTERALLPPSSCVSGVRDGSPAAATSLFALAASRSACSPSRTAMTADRLAHPLGVAQGRCEAVPVTHSYARSTQNTHGRRSCTESCTRCRTSSGPRPRQHWRFEASAIPTTRPPRGRSGSRDRSPCDPVPAGAGARPGTETDNPRRVSNQQVVVDVSRRLRPCPATIDGLRWLARVGAAPIDAWACAMGWAWPTARSHATRLSRGGWVARTWLSRGQGSPLFVTRTGVHVADVPVPESPPPAPT